MIFSLIIAFILVNFFSANGCFFNFICNQNLTAPSTKINVLGKPDLGQERGENAVSRIYASIRLNSQGMYAPYLPKVYRTRVYGERSMKIRNRRDCGDKRYAARYFIRTVLDEQGLSMQDVARRIGVSGEAVTATVRGRIHSPRVLDELRTLGVPEEYLFDPRKLLRAPSA